MKFIRFLFCISLPVLSFGQDLTSSDELQFSTPIVATNAPGAFTGEGAKRLWVQAAREYETNPVPWVGDGLLMVGRGYVMENKYDAAIPAYKRLLEEEPTNALAAFELGKVYMLAHKYDNSIGELQTAWNLGSNMALKDLAGLYILRGRCSEIKPYVDDLFKVRERFDDSNNKHDTTDILLFYSLNGESAPNKALFLKAIDGLSDQVITSRTQTAQLAIDGLEAFGLNERANKLKSELK